jgi:hypothetical protein
MPIIQWVIPLGLLLIGLVAVKLEGLERLIYLVIVVVGLLLGLYYILYKEPYYVCRNCGACSLLPRLSCPKCGENFSELEERGFLKARRARKGER